VVAVADQDHQLGAPEELAVVEADRHLAQLFPEMQLIMEVEAVVLLAVTTEVLVMLELLLLQQLVLPQV